MGTCEIYQNVDWARRKAEGGSSGRGKELAYSYILLQIKMISMIRSIFSSESSCPGCDFYPTSLCWSRDILRAKQHGSENDGAVTITLTRIIIVALA